MVSVCLPNGQRGTIDSGNQPCRSLGVTDCAQVLAKSILLRQPLPHSGEEDLFALAWQRSTDLKSMFELLHAGARLRVFAHVSCVPPGKNGGSVEVRLHDGTEVNARVRTPEELREVLPTLPTEAEWRAARDEYILAIEDPLLRLLHACSADRIALVAPTPSIAATIAADAWAASTSLEGMEEWLAWSGDADLRRRAKEAAATAQQNWDFGELVSDSLLPLGDIVSNFTNMAIAIRAAIPVPPTLVQVLAARASTAAVAPDA